MFPDIAVMELICLPEEMGIIFLNISSQVVFIMEVLCFLESSSSYSIF